MKDTVLAWFGVISLLVFVFLVVKNGQDSVNVINALSHANTSAINALQGQRVN